MDAPPGLALVGLGDAGKHHARALRALHHQGVVRWVGVCGRDPGRRSDFCATHGGGVALAGFSSLDALLAAGVVDAVVLATPDGVHATQATRVAEAGVHALVEKPLALRGDEARDLVRAFGERQLALAVGYQLRHHAGHRTVRRALRQLVGRLRRIDVRWAWPDPAVDGWRAQGGGSRWWSLAALGTHALDLALWFAGRPPEAAQTVLAMIDQGGPVDRRASVLLGLPEAVEVSVTVSVEYRSVPRLSLLGDEGEVEALGTLGARGGGTLTLRRPRGEESPLEFQPEDPYLAQLRDFVQALREGRPPEASGADGAAQVELLERLGSSGCTLGA